MQTFVMIAGSMSIVPGIFVISRENFIYRSDGEREKINFTGLVNIGQGAFLVIAASSWRSPVAALCAIVSFVIGFGGGLLLVFRWFRSRQADPW